MNRTDRLVTFAAASLLASSLAHAEPACIGIEGTVMILEDPAHHFGDRISVGSKLAGHYFYDTDAPTNSPADNQAFYRFPPSIGGMQLKIGDVNFQSDPARGGLDMLVWDNYTGIDRLSMSFPYFGTNEVQTDDPSNMYATWDLSDSTQTALNSVALSLSPPDLSLFTQPWGLDVAFAVPSGMYIVRSIITSATACGDNHDADNDGDGVTDTEDQCPASDLSPTVFVGTADTGVENRLDEQGCTIADRLSAVNGSKNHGALVSAVAKVSNLLLSQGRLSGAEKGRIQSAVARKK
jgi:hypothetical protein